MKGGIEGVIHPYHGGAVTTLSEVAAFATEEDLVGVVLDIKQKGDGAELEEITPKFLQLSVLSAFDESSYRNGVTLEYLKNYPYDASKDSLPWIIINSVKSISDAEFKLEISKGGSVCTLGGNMENSNSLLINYAMLNKLRGDKTSPLILFIDVNSYKLFQM